MMADDLNRAQTNSARACFVMSQQRQAGGLRDSTAAVYSMAVKQRYPHVPTIVQVENTTGKELALDNDSDRVICLEELKLTILARNCLAPGFSTLVTNLVRTYRSPKSQVRDLWLMEYGRQHLSDITRRLTGCS